MDSFLVLSEYHHIIRLIDIAMAGKIESMLRCTPQQTAGRQQEEFYYDVLILSDRLLSMKPSSIRHIQVNVIQHLTIKRIAGEIIPLEEATKGLGFAWLLRRRAMVGVPSEQHNMSQQDNSCAQRIQRKWKELLMIRV